MPERRLTDAWGDRWDVSQPTPLKGTDETELRFRHQSGREFRTRARSLDSLSDHALLERLEAVLQDEGVDWSVLRGLDAKADPEGYANPDRGRGGP